jgi:hypothetical protein
MKKVFSIVVLSVVLGSCKVSDLVSVDTLVNAEMLKEYQTFKMIEEDYSDKRNERIKLIFRDKLIDFGFDEASENPDFLIQGVIVSREFIEKQGIPSSSSIPGPFHTAIRSRDDFPEDEEAWGRPVINSGMIGKAIFLIQDAKTNEIAWMGISSGVVYGGDRQFDLDKMDLVLHQLLTSLYE